MNRKTFLQSISAAIVGFFGVKAVKEDPVRVSIKYRKSDGTVGYLMDHDRKIVVSEESMRRVLQIHERRRKNRELLG